MGEEIAFENGRISDFQGLVTLTLTLDRVILHTFMHHSSTSTHIQNFIEIGETFCGRTDGRTFETHFISSTRRSRPKKATTRLYFLKQLRRAGLSNSHLLHFYITVIRPVLAYCAPVWHYKLTKAQSESLEAIQKRVIHITHNFTCMWNAVFLHAILRKSWLVDFPQRRYFSWFFICLIAIAYSMGQIIKSFCVCPCVCVCACPSVDTLTVAFLRRFSPNWTQTCKPPK